MTELAEGPPLLRHPDVVMGAPLRRGDTVVHYVKDPRTGWYYQMGAREFFLLSQMDGRRTRAEIEAAYAERFRRRLTDAHWESLLRMLHSRHLLVDPDATGTGDTGADPIAQSRVRAETERRSVRRRLMYARFPLFKPDRFLRWLAPRVGLLYSPWFVVPALVASLIALGMAMADVSALWSASRMNVGHPLAVVSFGTTWLVIALHEAAHGLTSRRYGGAVAEMGVLWRFPLLTPYCKTDDVVLFTRRRHRVYTAFSGVFVNLLALVPFTVAWHVTTPGTHGHALAGSLLLYGGLATVSNLLPVFRLDGYFMLNHAVGLADLRAETYRFWGALVRRQPTGSYRRGDRVLYTLYGCAVFGTLTAVLVGIVGVWYWSLERWIGPFGAVAVLGTEAVLVFFGIRFLIRRRARRRAAAQEAAVATRPAVPATGDATSQAEPAVNENTAAAGKEPVAASAPTGGTV